MTELLRTGVLVAFGLLLTELLPADEQGEPAATVQADTTPLVIEAIIDAPVAEVWKVFSTAEGYRKLGVAQCEMDLRVGGLIRSHYDPQGVLGDEGTIVQEVLAFEPERMIAFRLKKAPKDFPFAEQTWQGTWSVATFADLDGAATHVRVTGLGYTSAPESRQMRGFFAKGNAWVMEHLRQQFGAAADERASGGMSLAAIRHDRVIELPREAVWKLLSTGAGWERFLGVGARVELRPGGRFEILFDSSAPKGQRGSEGCAVLSFVPEQMISFTWNAPPKFAHARAERTWVVIRLDRLSAKRTLVRLDHLGFAELAEAHPEHRDEWEAVRAYFAPAWGNVLTALQAQSAAPKQSAGSPTG